MMVLAGDVGGTKTDLGLFELRDDYGMPDMVEHHRVRSRDHDGLTSALLAWRQERMPPVRAAAFGVAGPIVGGRVETTNLPWVIERRDLEEKLGCPVALINDLEAMAHGACALRGKDLLILNEGREVERGARAIIAAGSGLGEGYMVYDRSAGAYMAQPSEGGHCDFAARAPEEIALLETLGARYGRVSVERVVSGPGIEAIFAHLAARHGAPPTGGATAAEISAAAIAGGPPICVEAMRLFVSAYGAEAGNLALKVMALGGLYVGGGIAPKILPLMTSGDAGGEFMRAFTDKGRFSPLMRNIPVRIALNERTSLIGAALVAGRLASC